MTTELKCESWCTEGDGHPREMYRADQWCQGPMRMTVLGLESPNSPALPVCLEPIFEWPVGANNADPVTADGFCCDSCNRQIVIPTREAQQ